MQLLAAGRAGRTPPEAAHEIEPVAQLGEGIVQAEVVVMSTGDGKEELEERPQAARETAGVSGRRSAQDLHQMAYVSQQPSAADAVRISGGLRGIAGERQLGDEAREVEAGVH